MMNPMTSTKKRYWSILKTFLNNQKIPCIILKFFFPSAHIAWNKIRSVYSSNIVFKDKQILSVALANIKTLGHFLLHGPT